MRRLNPLLACLGMLLITTPAILHAQTDLLAQLGTPAGTSSISFPQGFVDLENSNFQIEIPIETLKQRDGTNLTVSLVYGSLFYYVFEDSAGDLSWTFPGVQNNPLTNVAVEIGTGWGYVVSRGASNGNIAFTEVDTTCYSGETAPEQTYSNWQYIDNSGTAHAFGTVSTSQSGYEYCPDQPTAYGAATDGSGYYISITNYANATIYDSHGDVVYSYYTDPNNYNNDATRWTDTNGNIVSYRILQTNSLTDELGRTVTLPSGFSVQTSSIQVGTAFEEPYVAEYSGSLDVLTGITLPDGKTYSFTYDGGGAGHSGVMTSMTLPTGGTVSFQPQMQTGGEPDYGPVNLAQLSTPDGTTGFTWSSSNGTETTVVTASPDPRTGLSSQSTYVNSCNSGTTSCASTLSVYPGTASGTPLKATTTQFDQNLRPTSVTTSLDGISQTTNYGYYAMPYPSGTSAGEAGYTYATSLISSRQDYDYSGSLLREIDASYQVLSSSATGAAIARPTQVSVYGPGGALAAQTTYGYDGTTLNATSGSRGNSVIGSTGHDDTDYGSGMTGRGNVTSVTQMIGSGSTLTTQTNTYNILGEVVQSIDASGSATTNYDYSDNFNSACAAGLGLPSGSTFAYPTLMTNALNQQTVASYQSCDGQKASVQDPNDAVTTYSYDSRQRPASIQYPDGGSTSYQYFPTYTSESRAMNSGLNAITQTRYDGLGRTSRIAVFNGNSNAGLDWYQQDTCYGPNGQLAFQSYNYQGPGFIQSPVCSGVGDAYSYDALGRTTQALHGDGTSVSYQYAGPATEATDENGVQRISQVDALGRLTAVCEISSNGNMPGSGSPGACGLDLSGTGFLMAYAYNLANNTTTVTQGVQTRVFQTDALGRTILVQEPESGQTTYSYAYNGTGLVVTRQRPQANQKNSSVLTTTTTQYDALSRVLSVVYSDGTPYKSFAYDQATVWGAR